MTTHAINQNYFAALIFDSGERIELGCASMPVIYQRLMGNVKATQLDFSHATLVFGLTKTDLKAGSKVGAKPKYAHEGENPDSPLYGMTEEMIARIQPASDDDPSPFEGISMTRLMEGQASQEYKAYLHFAINPENRVGVTEGVITAARDMWWAHYPDLAVHVPVWKD